MISNEQARDLIGAAVVDAQGDKIGKVGQVFLDDETGTPEWVTVKTGLLGTRESFAPLAQAQLAGGQLKVPYGKDQVKGAPSVEADGDLSQDEGAQLYSHYGLGYTEQASGSGLPTAATTPPPAQAARPAPQPASGGAPRTGNVPISVTRAEERLAVGTERVQTGRMRLRKYIATEQVAAQVAVSSEQVRVTREAITDPSAVPARLQEAETEVVLTAERPVVEKEVVPVERVRLAKTQVADQAVVADQVRSEQVEMIEERDGKVTVTDVDSGPRH